MILIGISILILVALCISLASALVNANGRIKTTYIQGRFDAWKDFENLTLSRAKAKGYDVDKFLEDILQ